MKELKKSLAASHSSRAHHLMNGGRHPDEKADRSLVKKMVKPSSLTGKKSGGECHAHGGAAKRKGSKTQVNVISLPPRSAAPVSAPGGAMPGPVPAMPSRPPVPAAPAGGLGALQGVGAKRGGKIAKRAAGGRITGYDAGAMTGEGRLEKEAHMKRKGHVK